MSGKGTRQGTVLPPLRSRQFKTSIRVRVHVSIRRTPEACLRRRVTLLAIRRKGGKAPGLVPLEPARVPHSRPLRRRRETCESHRSAKRACSLSIFPTTTPFTPPLPRRHSFPSRMHRAAGIVSYHRQKTPFFAYAPRREAAPRAELSYSNRAQG